MSTHRFPRLAALSGPLPTGNGVHHVRLADGRHAWLKQRRDRPAAFLLAEADGLERLRVAGGLRVPKLLGLDAHQLLLEDLGQGRPAADFAPRAGRGLAVQHACSSDTYGLSRAGWCGESPQDNTPDRDGHRFFAERRLLPQARRALDAGRMDHADMRRIEHLCGRLPDLVPSQPPALLHGDLWSGNLHCCANGEPALIDTGAVHYGWAEAELAMLVLFGGPDEGFFHAYAEQGGLRDDWRERAPLYNLYHLLNHLNLFGGGYLGPVRAALARYVPRH